MPILSSPPVPAPMPFPPGVGPSSMETPAAVLFCCSYNSVRSPMAQAFLRHYHGTRIYVKSTGLRSGELVNGFAVAVMMELGLDITRHQPKTFEELQDDFFDLIISLSAPAQHHAVEMTRTMACDIEYWPMPDATAVEGSRDDRLTAYRQVRDLIRQRVLQRFPPE